MSTALKGKAVPSLMKHRSASYACVFLLAAKPFTPPPLPKALMRRQSTAKMRGLIEEEDERKRLKKEEDEVSASLSFLYKTPKNERYSVAFLVSRKCGQSSNELSLTLLSSDSRYIFRETAEALSHGVNANPWSHALASCSPQSRGWLKP